MTLFGAKLFRESVRISNEPPHKSIPRTSVGNRQPLCGKPALGNRTPTSPEREHLLEARKNSTEEKVPGNWILKNKHHHTIITSTIDGSNGCPILAGVRVNTIRARGGGVCDTPDGSLSKKKHVANKKKQEHIAPSCQHQGKHPPSDQSKGTSPNHKRSDV